MTWKRPVLGTRLTSMEIRTIVALCERGESNKQLAARLNYQQETIKRHISNACLRIGVSNRTALAVWWLRGGWRQYEAEIEALNGRVIHQ